ncbi:ABC transporter permease [Helicobacter marmotae]|uniref:ABC transporter permease n=1 Tax=Helicobacter marmotae TaxID=152490 RepID=A0A3D8I587_9HELI|nr:ABC transporter permease [Helicobacter marmotae]RDU60312.1 ABC transporter permease [Helicobacter marmotae]
MSTYFLHFLKFFKREFDGFIRDKFSLFLCTLAPLVLGAFVWAVFSESFVRAAGIGVVDLDKSTLSRELIANLESIPTLKVTHYYESLQEAKADMSNVNIYALMVLPQGLQARSKKGILTEIPIYYNAQLMLVAKSIEGAFKQLILSSNVKAKLGKNLIQTHNLNAALALSSPILMQITPLYNSNNSYAQFLITGILPCSLIMLMIICVINSLARDESDVGFIPNKASQMPQGIKANVYILTKVCAYTGIFSFWWAVMMIFFHMLGFSFRGSYFTLYCGALLTLLGYGGVGVFAYALLKDHTRALALAAIYCAPSFAFTGITFPANSMGAFGSFWHTILPISHYLKLYVQVANYGVDFFGAFKTLCEIAPFLLFLAFGVLIYKRRETLREV